MKINIPICAKSYEAYQIYKHENNIILCYPNEEAAIEAHEQLISYENSENILYFPSFDTNPYDRISPNSTVLFHRANVLSKLASTQNKHQIIVTNICNLLNYLPPVEIFKNSTMKLQVKDQINIEQIINFLTYNGFRRVTTAIDNGEFAVRGENLDIVISSIGYRITCAWGMIENIRQYDTYSQTTTDIVTQIILSPASEYPINFNTIDNFKRKFSANFGVNHLTSSVYNSVIHGMRYNGYEYLGPLFYSNMSNLYDYLERPVIIYDDLALYAIKEYEQLYKESYNLRLDANKLDPESYYYALKPELIQNIDGLESILTNEHNLYITSSIYEDAKYQIVHNISPEVRSLNKLNIEFISYIASCYHDKNIVICFYNSKSRDKFKNILANDQNLYDIKYLTDAQKKRINLLICPLSQSFISHDILFIAEIDMLGKQEHRPGISSKQKLTNILTELDSIKAGDFIVHKEHGIGQFDKIETLHVDNIAHDCIKILYANDDIFYLPVENINQLKKYGGDDVTLDKLGYVEWQKRKAKLKNKIMDIAKQLMQITAKRQLMRVAEVHFEKAAYDKFCQGFPYNETQDQQAAINDIQEDLNSGRLMDRLICGDVGFGKTEVAMRAAFMIASDLNEDTPQVVIISPTTILSKQHYTNFLTRFAGTNLKIAHISRLVKPAQVRVIKADIVAGKVNIIIGTHALLANNINFKNLKMVIIDEEQHFGVLQKEKLKQLKSGIHVLALSATPIPRSLQMSMVGIKDLSLITTPPVDRLSISTRILPYDAVIIRDALMRERQRGGLSFVVTPKIKDIEAITQQLDLIVPELQYKIAHGRMNPSVIDNIMSEFCDAKFDILVSTTIIESGIDIPIANTIIVSGAEKLGLSQIYQLRGRVGRRKERGYAYLVFSNKTKISKYSARRLEILQNLNTLGAGFAIASHDMDLRGFGNLIGDEQSGHIREVGSELYQEMLDEAIAELKKEGQDKFEITPKINLKIPILIPETYIDDSSLRLAIYRRTGLLKDNNDIENFKLEMEDRFGALPSEFLNLLEVVEIRNKCSELKIESLDSGQEGFVIKFNDNFDRNETVMRFIQRNPRNAKIKPDNKLIYITKLHQGNLLKEVNQLLEQL
ncbi:MAG: transcription-repair coupling factor [Rickettsiaceae bacterium]|nr:transcription-repair coupling factor [Rickettsiaceae bacterium]